MTSKEKVLANLNHKQTDKVAIDFGSTPVTGIHVLAVERLREFYGLEKKPLKVIEPYQMLGEIDEDLQEILGIDVIGISPRSNLFGIHQENWKETTTLWGQEVIVPGDFNTSQDSEGNLFIHPEGDLNAPASGKMPKVGYFFDAIVRQDPIEEATLNVESNLEEFELFTDEDLEYWKLQINSIRDSDKAVIANFGGTGLGDIALVPAMNLKYPKGIRDIAEWYMSVLIRPEYVQSIFEKQTDIAIKNLEEVSKIAGDKIDIIYICGTDFGTQDSSFCSPETFHEMWSPFYSRINDWVHQNTSWKTFKHSCGAVEPFMDEFIEAGFDIVNPVQINAAGMDPEHLKREYGDKLVFWGGGVDTQKMLPFGSPQQVEDQVLKQCDLMSRNGGFVFNTVHNIQANVPLENIVAMINGLKKFNGE